MAAMAKPMLWTPSGFMGPMTVFCGNAQHLCPCQDPGKERIPLEHHVPRAWDTHLTFPTFMMHLSACGTHESVLK